MKLRTISRAKSVQGVSASFRRFPPRRAIVEKAAISEGLEVSALSALSAGHFRVSANGDAREQRFDRGGIGNVEALLHGIGELGMGGVVRAPFAGAAGVLAFLEGGRPGRTCLMLLTRDWSVFK